ncbi:hypothetical protein P3T40_003047 [Paraburkholderia sp. EB58]|jgi:hypothetical protein
MIAIFVMILSFAAVCVVKKAAERLPAWQRL